jgi:integrase
MKIRNPRTTLQEAVMSCAAAKWAGAKAEDSSVRRAMAMSQTLGPSTRVDKITRRVVLDAVSKLRAEGLAPGSINRGLSALNVVLDHAQDMGWRTDGGFDKIMLKEPRGRLRVVSDLELSKLLVEMTRESRVDEAAVVVFLRGTGMRVSEALALKWEDFAAPGEPGSGPYGMVLIRESKNDSSRHIPLSAQAHLALVDSAARGDDRDGPFAHVSQSALNKAWKRAAKAIGVGDKEFVPHSLRHTRATELVSSGVPLAVVAKILGHKSIKSTMRYAHVSSADTLEWLTRAGKLS